MATLTLTAAATAAAQLLGVLDSGESLSAQQLTDALGLANALLDNWSSDQLQLLSVVRTTQVLTAAVQSYVVAGRPMSIEAASLINASGPGGEIEIVNAVKWGRIPDRQAQSYLPRYLFYDRGNPTGTMYLSPVPLGAGLSVELITFAALTQFADVTTPITMLPGYTRPLELALALELAPEYDMQPSAALFSNYKDAMARLRNLNAELLGREPAAGQVQAMSEPASPVPPNPGTQGN